ncbi:MAG: D-alanine--D-alanine ligase family protein [Gemmatimonadota bacterium]
MAVTYDAGAEAGPADAAGVLDALTAVVESLGRLGHAAFPVPVGRPFDRVIPRLEAVDAIFNLTEGLDGRGAGEARAAALQELSGRPVTGSTADTLALARRKDWANAVLAARGLPVPPWTVVAPPAGPDWAVFPAIVKPVAEDGSVGIDDDAVVETTWELRGAVSRAGSGSLVQAFIAGRELNVGIVGEAVLPVAEIVFSHRQRVVSYAAKWSPGSAADRGTRSVCPARISATLHDRVVALARDAWEAVGGRGYGRVDLRTDPAGEPWILEVNPNPDLAPDAGLARMAAAAGWGYDGLIERILEAR